MDHDKHQHEGSGQRSETPSPLKSLEELHQFMSDCAECQQEIEPYWQFCAHCGVRLATKCPGCGVPLPPAGAPACPGCGLEIPQGRA